MIREMNGIAHADHYVKMVNGQAVKVWTEEPPPFFHAYLSVKIGFYEAAVRIELPELMALKDQTPEERIANVKEVVAEAISQAFDVVKDMEAKGK